MSKKEYLSSQIITYIGNKRKLVKDIESEVINFGIQETRKPRQWQGFNI